MSAPSVLRRHRVVLTVLAVAGLVTAPSTADAAVGRTRDLTTPGQVRLVGSSTNPIGNQVALLGDVNGDGTGDLATAGAPDPSLTTVGSVVVVFGGTTRGRVSTDPLTAGRGFRINGVEVDLATRPFGPSVAAAGDVNGDGFADVVVGASGWRGANGLSTGRAYVIFGSRATTDVDLRSLTPSRGFAITVPDNYQLFGYQVSGVGDVNADGRADIAVAGSGAGALFEVHVIYGRTARTTLNLGAWSPSMGWRISGHATSSDGWDTISLGNSLAGLGDVNGDGRADLAVGAPSDRPVQNPSFFGAVYVVYGGRTTDVSAAAIGCGSCRANGVRVIGGLDPLFGGWEVGAAVAAPGDVNGDGLADLLAGTDDGLRGAYVVFGGRSLPAQINLVNSFGGFAMRSATSGPGDPCCHPGHRVARAGDVNGDGRADLLVGNPADSPTVAGVRRDLSGQVFVVYGKASTAAVDVENLPASAGYRIVGGVFLDGFATGLSIDGGRDVTGDGLGDLLVGSGQLPGDPGDVGGVDVIARP